MSLVLYISNKNVIISKYNLEFRFSPPPSNLTKAALEAYKLLRKSEVLQTESSRNEREEVITLLKHYGQSLYQSVIPEQVRTHIYKAGGLFVFSLEKDILEIPWELLYDGTSFFGLTQGIIRIQASDFCVGVEPQDNQIESLKVSLNSYTPYEETDSSSNFVTCVEELAKGAASQFSLIDWSVNGNANHESLSLALRNFPHLFYFSGFDAQGCWTLDNLFAEASENEHWFKTDLPSEFKTALNNGLRILLLKTTSTLESDSMESQIQLKTFYNLGLPYAISFDGRIDRKRITEYFNIFLLGLLRGENLLRAHRLAINHIQSSLALSWDWSWIRLHINQKLLETTNRDPFPSYNFIQQVEKRPPREDQFKLDQFVFNGRRFLESKKSLKKLIQNAFLSDSDEILYLTPEEGINAESFVHEFLRRILPEHNVAISLLYYQRWGFGQDKQQRLNASKFADLFSFLTSDSEISTCFDLQTLDIAVPREKEESYKLQLVYYPPQKKDPVFDKWLTRKQTEGWQIICISDKKFATDLKISSVPKEDLNVQQIANVFEDELPESWIQLLEKGQPPAMKSIWLMKLIHASKSKNLIDLFSKGSSFKQIIKKTYSEIIASLSSNQLKILTILYLTRIQLSKYQLAELLGLKNVENELDFLFKGFLIESDITNNWYWLGINVRSHLSDFRILKESSLKTIGQELLKKIIGAIDVNAIDPKLAQTGFQFCLSELNSLKMQENALQRNLQIGRKLSKKFNSSFIYQQNICTSLELALSSKKGQLIQKTLFSLVDILEHLPFVDQTVTLCEWLLAVEKKHRNWVLVSEMQMKIASIYSRLNKKEKAIGLISSAIKLNNDIKNFSSRHQNLIAIALLLLDLEEYDKLKKLLANANFDMSLLNKEEIAKLWLIDGHILFSDGKFDEAQVSLSKIFDQNPPIISESILAKTYLRLAEIAQNNRDVSQYLDLLEKASYYFENCGDIEKAAELHELLHELMESNEELEKAVLHLEWIYKYYSENQNRAQIRRIADLLGGLYYRIGEHTKSTDFYSIAQGM